MRSTPDLGFIRGDGRPLQVVPGFRARALGERPPITPQPHWSAADYAASAERKLKRARKLMDALAPWHDGLERAALLEVGCGDGITGLLLARYGVGRVVGIDLRPRLFAGDEAGAQARRLAQVVLARVDPAARLADEIRRLPARFAWADVVRAPFPDDHFDILVSHSAMEHIAPVDRALAEMARVVRHGGLIYHSIDPYYWLKGCHKRGVVDIPWAHARLSLEDFRRFVTEYEGQATAAQRVARLESLNRLTLAQWRATIEAGPFEVLQWREEPSAFANAVLAEHPEVIDSRWDGVEERDLVCARLNVWLRVRKP